MVSDALLTNNVQETVANLGKLIINTNITVIYTKNTNPTSLDLIFTLDINASPFSSLDLYDLSGKLLIHRDINPPVVITSSTLLKETIYYYGLEINVTDHSLLSNRDMDDQHPMSAITGLSDLATQVNELSEFGTTWLGQIQQNNTNVTQINLTTFAQNVLQTAGFPITLNPNMSVTDLDNHRWVYTTQNSISSWIDNGTTGITQATITNIGGAMIATPTDITNGTDNTKIVTPAGLAQGVAVLQNQIDAILTSGGIVKTVNDIKPDDAGNIIIYASDIQDFTAYATIDTPAGAYQDKINKAIDTSVGRMQSANSINFSSGNNLPSKTWSAMTTNAPKLILVSLPDGIGASSIDGLTWNSITVSPTYINWNDIDYNVGYYVAVCTNFSNVYAKSPDGITWTFGTVAVSGSLRISSNPTGVWIIINSGTLDTYYSTDITKTAWTHNKIAGTTFVPSDIAWGNNTFVAVTPNGVSLTNSTGTVPWVVHTTITVANWTFLNFCSNNFVAVASNTNQLTFSTDGITWTNVTLPVVGNWANPVDIMGTCFLLDRNNSNVLLFSKDLINWKSFMFTATKQNWSCIGTNNNNQLVIAGNSNTTSIVSILSPFLMLI